MGLGRDAVESIVGHHVITCNRIPVGYQKPLLKEAYI